MFTRRELVRTVAAAASGLAVTSKGIAAEYQQYDGLGLAQLITTKQITPLELLNAVHVRSEAVNAKLSALCQQFFDKAEAQVREGLPNGPFRGVPFVLKDLNHQLAGTPTTYASRLFKDSAYDSDSTLVTRYKQAGLVIFGKSTTPEMGLSPATESAMFGATRNPWNTERTVGGSSGGAAALVATRTVPMAHATDGGGSIRIPASCCGVFGLKPTRGRVPHGPAAFEGWAGMSIAHAETISVRDSAALLDATAGKSFLRPIATDNAEDFKQGAKLGALWYLPHRQRVFSLSSGSSGIEHASHLGWFATSAGRIVRPHMGQWRSSYMS